MRWMGDKGKGEKVVAKYGGAQGNKQTNEKYITALITIIESGRVQAARPPQPLA